MNVALSKALIALAPVGLLVAGAAVLFVRRRNAFPLMQLVGAACLLGVAFVHICEALHLFPGMQWGLEHSAGHYLDLSAAVVGLTLFCLGYFLHALDSG